MKITKLLVVLFLSSVSVFADTSTVKLRKLEFKTVDVFVQSSPTAVHLQYSDVVRQVLLSPSQGGSTADQLVKVVETWEPIKKDIDAGKKETLLTDEAYQTLLNKVNTMSWSPPVEVATAMVDFIKYVRGLKEEDFDASPKK